MQDQRRLYINQILNHYRIPDSKDNNIYTVQYTYNGKEQHHKFFYHNDGLEYVKNYIKELQDKIDELQYIERIITSAKEGTL